MDLPRLVTPLRTLPFLGFAFELDFSGSPFRLSSFCGCQVQMRLLHGRAFFVFLGLICHISLVVAITACTELLTPSQVPWTNTTRYSPLSIANPSWARNSFDGTQGAF